MAVAWPECLETGIAALDGDHRHLLDLLNLLEQARQKAGGTVLTWPTVHDLGDFFRAHFEREEAVIAELVPSLLLEHRLEHKLMITAFGELVAGLTEMGACADDTVIAFLTEWISTHLDSDVDMAGRLRQLASKEVA